MVPGRRWSQRIRPTRVAVVLDHADRLAGVGDVLGGLDAELVLERPQVAADGFADFGFVFEGEDGDLVHGVDSWVRMAIERQVDGENGAAGLRVEADRAAVAFDDGLADRQAEAEAELDASALGGEAGVEDVRLGLGGDAGAVVLDLDPDRRRLPAWRCGS